MKTKTIIYKTTHNKAIISLALFFVLANFLTFPVSAQTTDGDQVPDCEPFPTDLELILQCNELGSTGQIIDYTGTLQTGPGTGSYGMSSAYNPTNNTIFFVSSILYGYGIVGQLYNADTLAPIGSQITIDDWDLFVGSPKVVYNPETNQFFVIWAASESSSATELQGRVVNADLTMPSAPQYIGGNAYMPKLTIDTTNDKYVVVYETAPDAHPVIVRVNYDGTVSSLVSGTINASTYEGQTGITYNSNLNEYWYVYIWGVSGSDTAQEDTRVMLSRIDASTMQAVGTPTQLSQTRIGRNAFSAPGIAYSPTDGAAVITWAEGGRTPGMALEVYGRTLYDNLSLSNEYPILTSTTSQTSDFYGGSANLVYNPYTGTFAVGGEDNNGGTTIAEFLPDGSILDIREAIPFLGNNGNFMPMIGSLPDGFLVATSPDYGSVKFNVAESPFEVVVPYVPTTYTRTPVVLNTASIPTFVSQIYVISLGVAGIAAMVMVVIGGYVVMTARGNGAQVQKGKDYLQSAIIGLVLLMAAFLIS
ncbi:MAG: pilin, partial [Candidatus Doudnabacteria bacterium]|nr:pilin [Candidatus Doudnabacteria bacterium]